MRERKAAGGDSLTHIHRHPYITLLWIRAGDDGATKAEASKCVLRGLQGRPGNHCKDEEEENQEQSLFSVAGNLLAAKLDHAHEATCSSKGRARCFF